MKVLRLTAYPAAHPLLEALGYAIAFAVYKRDRQHSGDVLDNHQRWSVIAATCCGALVGSRVLGLLEQSPRQHIALLQLVTPGGGKTIVGGLLGGWLAVEITKATMGITSRTGDLFAIPLCIGIAIGRVGCLLAGLADDTYGKPTALPWGVDFGDGISRHPTQAYEILFLFALGLLLRNIATRKHRNGLLFQFFLAAYLTWRFCIDFLKPQPTIGGMNIIQWACLAGLTVLIITSMGTFLNVRPTAKEENA